MNCESRCVWLLRASERGHECQKEYQCSYPQSPLQETLLSLVRGPTKSAEPLTGATSNILSLGTTHQMVEIVTGLQQQSVPQLRYLHHSQLRHPLFMHLPPTRGTPTTQHRHNHCRLCSHRLRFEARLPSRFKQQGIHRAQLRHRILISCA